MAISRDLLLKKSPRVVRDYKFPEDFPEGFAGQTFHVMRMTAKERGQFESQFATKAGKPLATRQREVRQRLVIETFCDETATRLLTENDLEGLGEQDGVIVEFIAAAATETNRISETDLESLAKN
ncbi:hypothetical protein SH661x_002318 [Planctomicrobium sp. SH661]|uniref:hypothetical protein n=1 Tax=Planctomicrobium sp. SH661 TaxID=3448124 RepID=UPI003F5C3CCD